jgi:hypothetical protein
VAGPYSERVSIVAHIAVGAPIGCALLTGLVTGCAHGPGLSEAVEQLHADTRALLRDAAERLGPDGARPDVLADLTRPCAEGRARWEFRGRVPLRPGPDIRIVLDLATDVALAMVRARGYRLEQPPRGAGTHHRSFIMTREMPPINMVVRLRGGHHAFLELAATTPCLAPR